VRIVDVPLGIEVNVAYSYGGVEFEISHYLIILYPVKPPDERLRSLQSNYTYHFCMSLE